MLGRLIQQALWRWLGAHLPTQADFDNLEAAIQEHAQTMGLSKPCP